MPATVTSVTRRPTSGPDRTPRREALRPFRDNPRLILAGIGVLAVLLVAILTVDRPRDLLQGRRLITSCDRLDTVRLADPVIPLKSAIAT